MESVITVSSVSLSRLSVQMPRALMFAQVCKFKRLSSKNITFNNVV